MPRVRRLSVRAAVRGWSIDAGVGDARVPVGELGQEVVDVVEVAAGREVALDVLDARLDLAVGLRAIRPAQARFEAPVVALKKPLSPPGSANQLSKDLTNAASLDHRHTITDTAQANNSSTASDSKVRIRNYCRLSFSTSSIGQLAPYSELLQNRLLRFDRNSIHRALGRLRQHIYRHQVYRANLC